jgi:dTDP-4-amino-4,6-dideoxygalactose transaminase
MTLLQTQQLPKLRVPYTNFPAQFSDHRQEIEAAIGKVLRRGDFILGEEVEAFEKEFAALCVVDHAMGVANGTDALILALRVLGIGPGDEVITVPNSWISTASSIVHAGARPVFVDVAEDYLIDPSKIEAAVTARTKAILPVHLTGRIADMEAIDDIAKRHHLFVVEDAAQATGAQRKGKTAGSFGTVGCFSFHPLKNLNGVGDGGMVVTNDEELAQRLRLARNHGLKNREEVAIWGFNSRLDTLQAAVLRVRLKFLQEVTEARRRNADRYREKLSLVVTTPMEGPHERAIDHLFMIQCDRRDALQEFLAKRGIETKIHYPIPIHLQPCSAALGYRPGDLPMAEEQAGRILSLPVHQNLTPEDVEMVCQAILEFYEGRR